jgi:hypothetical protein
MHCMITHQPTLVPGMQPGEHAYTVRIANEDDSEKEMFNIVVALDGSNAEGIHVNARRLDSSSKVVSVIEGASGATLAEAIEAAAQALASKAAA